MTVRYKLQEAGRRVAGVDEAGRGPLAGPVVAAAVILDPSRPIRGLKDSKQLTAEAREGLAEEITHSALAWAWPGRTMKRSTSMNILQASLLAMARAWRRSRPNRTGGGGRQPLSQGDAAGHGGDKGRCHGARHQRRLHPRQGGAGRGHVPSGYPLSGLRLRYPQGLPHASIWPPWMPRAPVPSTGGPSARCAVVSRRPWA